MGGSSKSSSDQQQETTQLTSDGVIVGDLFQGKDVVVNQEFSSGVESVFGQLIDLAGNSVALAGSAGERALDSSATAIGLVSDRASFSENPELQTIDRLIPIVAIGGIAISAYLFYKGRI